MRAALLQSGFSLSWTIFQLFILLWQPSPAAAAEFRVNSIQDVNDLDPGNGLCVAYLTIFPPFVIPFCTLRAAIEETNSLPGPDTIHIPAASLLLAIDGINENMAATGDLDITDNLLIRGQGASSTRVDGNGLDRVFDIPDPTTMVTMEHFSITNGSLPALLAASQKGGGGIRNRGDLTLRNVVFDNNRVHGSGNGDAGGGLFNGGSSQVIDSTIMNNQAATGGGIYNDAGAFLNISAVTVNNNAARSGGGLANQGTAEIVNTTVSGNNVINGVFPFGGGICNTSEMSIRQSTVTGNGSPLQGGGISNQGYMEIVNTIVAGNDQTNCYLTQLLDSLGSNLDDDNSCSLDPGTDIINLDPKLSTLGDHGGPTPTHGLLIGSPAVDRGLDLTAMGITTDQRGVRRPDGVTFDIGAFETRKRSVVPFTVPLLCCGD